jgi:uncharacterized phiE125 gp8 family phage protein
MNWLEPEVTEAPTFLPVTLVQAKAAQRIETDEEDPLLTGYLMAAINHIETQYERRLATQTVKLRAWGLDCPTFVLPLSPIQSISAVTYLDAAGDEQTLSTDVYATALYGLFPTVALKHRQCWPVHQRGLGSVVFTCQAGYAEGDAPAVIQQAVLILFGDFNTYREQAAAGIISAVASVAIDNLLTNQHRLRV